MQRKRNVFEGLAEELQRLIEAGAIADGEQLPSVRSYAVERKVNPNTVAKAYALLEERGYIRVELKKGAFVTYGKTAHTERNDGLKRCFIAWKEAGVTREEVLAALEEIFAGEKDYD